MSEQLRYKSTGKQVFPETDEKPEHQPSRREARDAALEEMAARSHARMEQARVAGPADAVKAFDARFGIKNPVVLDQIAKDYHRRAHEAGMKGEVINHNEVLTEIGNEALKRLGYKPIEDLERSEALSELREPRK
jgi:hypothetical protein